MSTDFSLLETILFVPDQGSIDTVYCTKLHSNCYHEQDSTY
jgi:hypothetical protein